MAVYLTSYSDCLTGFCKALSLPCRCHTGLKMSSSITEKERTSGLLVQNDHLVFWYRLIIWSSGTEWSSGLPVQNYHLVLYRVIIWSSCTEWSSGLPVQNDHLVFWYRIIIWSSGVYRMIIWSSGTEWSSGLLVQNDHLVFLSIIGWSLFRPWAEWFVDRRKTGRVLCFAWLLTAKA